jgi:hypothetical protein
MDNDKQTPREFWESGCKNSVEKSQKLFPMLPVGILKMFEPGCYVVEAYNIRESLKTPVFPLGTGKNANHVRID